MFEAGNLLFLGVITLIAIVVMVVVGLMISRLYKRATKETAYVRTGMGGQKVVKDGGALIIPVLHDTLDVNMSTLRLDVHRTGQDALLTLDKMRVDVEASFYTKVKPDAEAIAMAAQTLGKNTMDPMKLRALIENKFVDALRSVAATMNMSELNEKRAVFSQNVQNAIEHDLVKNGLELENVSITKLDQTDIKYLNENNVFDAEGLANITKITQAKAKERNDVQQETRVAIEKRNFEANQQSLTIKQQNEFATLEQEREVETRRAAQEADLSKQRADRKREADVATIEAEQATAIARTNAAQRQKEADIKATQELRLAEQIAQIAINEKSEAESKAKASADTARAEAVKAAEGVKTAEAVASAERAKEVALVAARQSAEQEATKITIKAKAEFDAAEMNAKAIMIRADAQQKENEVRAAGERAMAEAANSLSAEQVQLRIREAALKAAPAILAEIARPMAAVKGARIVSINGLSPTGATAGTIAEGGSGNSANDFANAMLGFRLRSPMADKLGEMVGVDLSQGLAGALDPEMFGLGEADTPVETVEVESDDVAKRTIQKLAGIKVDDKG